MWLHGALASGSGQATFRPRQHFMKAIKEFTLQESARKVHSGGVGLCCKSLN